jgi:hypothetical protein
LKKETLKKKQQAIVCSRKRASDTHYDEGKQLRSRIVAIDVSVSFLRFSERGKGRTGEINGASEEDGRKILARDES